MDAVVDSNATAVDLGKEAMIATRDALNRRLRGTEDKLRHVLQQTGRLHWKLEAVNVALHAIREMTNTACDQMSAVHKSTIDANTGKGLDAYSCSLINLYIYTDAVRREAMSCASFIGTLASTWVEDSLPR